MIGGLLLVLAGKHPFHAFWRELGVEVGSKDAPTLRLLLVLATAMSIGMILQMQGHWGRDAVMQPNTNLVRQGVVSDATMTSQLAHQSVCDDVRSTFPGWRQSSLLDCSECDSDSTWSPDDVKKLWYVAKNRLYRTEYASELREGESRIEFSSAVVAACVALMPLALGLAIGSKWVGPKPPLGWIGRFIAVPMALVVFLVDAVWIQTAGWIFLWLCAGIVHSSDSARHAAAGTVRDVKDSHINPASATTRFMTLSVAFGFVAVGMSFVCRYEEEQHFKRVFGYYSSLLNTKVKTPEEDSHHAKRSG